MGKSTANEWSTRRYLDMSQLDGILPAGSEPVSRHGRPFGIDSAHHAHGD